MPWNPRAIWIALPLVSWNTAGAQVTARVSVSTAGVQASGQSDFGSLSDDGRYVAFESWAVNLAAGDTNNDFDVFVRDRVTGATELVSIGLGGVPGNGLSVEPVISADGRYVVFDGLASDLVAGDTNGTWDVFVRDRVSGTTQRVSVDSAGGQASDASFYPSISADGRWVTFMSFADDLVAGDTNGAMDVFVHDRQTGATERVSVDSAGVQADRDSDTSCISQDGRFVAFSSLATNLVPGDTNDAYDVFVRDRQSGTTQRASVDSAGGEGNSHSFDPSMSGDGRYVVFRSGANDLVAGDTNGSLDTFLRDRSAAATSRVSVGSGGAEGNQGGDLGSISADGRFVAFGSFSSNLVAGDTNSNSDVFVRDLLSGTTVRASLTSDGRQGNGPSGTGFLGAISPDGRYVAFTSDASNLASGDTNANLDVYVRDALGGPAFTSLCEAGAGGVAPCPCANPPGGPGRGCDNSAGTGGAVLSAAGGTFISSDSLVFTAAGELPSAMSVVFQGKSVVPAGIVYGQGVRCAGGALKRLYAKNASGGGLTAPDFAAGDRSVSARSAAKGDVIQPGQSRWYFVAYRDPTVPGGCPAGSTFDATQTGRIDWSP